MGTRATIAVTPQRDESAQRISLETELRMVRSALLYADRVELIAPSVSMVWALRPLADVSDDNVLRRIASLDPRTFVALGMPATHVTEAKKMMRRAARQRPGSAFREQMEREWLPVVGAMREQANLALTADDAATFDLALKSGALVIHGEKFTYDGDTDEQVDWFIGQIEAGLADPSSALMLDSFTAERVRQEKALSFSGEGTAARSRRATLGTGLIERLPAFPDAPMALVLEARDELEEGRAKYRSATKTLAATLESHALEETLPHEIDEVWNDEVRPALESLDKSVSATQLARETAKAVVAGKVSPSAVVVGVGSLATGVLPAVSTPALEAGVAGIAFQALATVVKARSERRKHDLVYLADLQRRLS